jgi:hypothetical protein
MSDTHHINTKAYETDQSTSGDPKGVAESGSGEGERRIKANLTLLAALFNDTV